MNSFTPRKTEPTSDNKYYFSNDNIFHKYDFGMPNCTCYAWGRFYELLKTVPKLSSGDAEKWWGFTADGYARGSVPKLGAVVCWAKGSVETDEDGSGHVAIVEEILTDGTIITSNSSHNKTVFYVDTLQPPYNMTGYTFQGFIYPPVEFTTFPLWLLFKFNERSKRLC